MRVAVDLDDARRQVRAEWIKIVNAIAAAKATKLDDRTLAMFRDIYPPPVVD